MKTSKFVLVILLIAVIITPYCLFAQVTNPQAPSITWTLPLILSIIAGCYEVISRIIPTTKGWSIIGKVLEVLTWLSNLFDRKKK